MPTGQITFIMTRQCVTDISYGKQEYPISTKYTQSAKIKTHICHMK